MDVKGFLKKQGVRFQASYVKWTLTVGSSPRGLTAMLPRASCSGATQLPVR